MTTRSQYQQNLNMVQYMLNQHSQGKSVSLVDLRGFNSRSAAETLRVAEKYVADGVLEPLTGRRYKVISTVQLSREYKVLLGEIDRIDRAAKEAKAAPKKRKKEKSGARRDVFKPKVTLKPTPKATTVPRQPGEVPRKARTVSPVAACETEPPLPRAKAAGGKSVHPEIYEVDEDVFFNPRYGGQNDRDDFFDVGSFVDNFN